MQLQLGFFPLVMLGCLLACTPEEREIDPTAVPNYYLALGDSYTIGEGERIEARFPNQLTERFDGSSTPLLTPEIIAQTGWRTDNLLDAIRSAGLEESSFDLVTVLIGVNDQFQGISAADFSNELELLFTEAERYALSGAEDIVVLSIPDYSVTPFAERRDTAQIRREIDQFNSIVDQAARARGYRFVDITGISREARDDRSLLAPDGLHPSANMYARWVDLLQPEVEALLRE